MMLVLLLACAKQAPAEPAPTEPATTVPAEAPAHAAERAHARKSGAPVDLTAAVGADHTVITAAFEGQGMDVRLTAWGATGLEVAGEATRWSGTVEPGQQVVFEVEHGGSGDLAARVVGTFGGERVDEVRSWTVGERKPTVVPVQNGSKGWDATRR